MESSVHRVAGMGWRCCRLRQHRHCRICASSSCGAGADAPSREPAPRNPASARGSSHNDQRCSRNCPHNGRKESVVASALTHFNFFNIFTQAVGTETAFPSLHQVLQLEDKRAEARARGALCERSAAQHLRRRAPVQRVNSTVASRPQRMMIVPAPDPPVNRSSLRHLNIPSCPFKGCCYAILIDTQAACQVSAADVPARPTAKAASVHYPLTMPTVFRAR